ncbi:MAG: aminopeptidase [Phycisphaerae bacterium]|nr:aminopeptidase [Phycisphaerae bacterium]
MDPRLQKLAKVLVNYSAAVKPGDLVMIQGATITEPLIIELYRETLRAGGNPVVRVSTDALTEILIKEGTKEQLEYLNPLSMYEIENIDVRISLWGQENTRHLSNTDPKCHAILSASRRPFVKRFFERAATNEFRWTGSMYPTNSSAQDAGMSLGEYQDFVFTAGLLHLDDPIAAWKQIAVKQDQAVELLTGYKTLHLETANGTDLTMNLEGRKWISSCGNENFPDGEIFTCPVEDSVEGIINFSFPAIHMGHECSGVKLRFEKGKVVEASAETGQDFLISMLDQDEGARRVGEFAIGTNYAIREFTKNTLFDEKIGGTVHLAVGASLRKAGGVNDSGLHWDMVCDLRPGGRITLDDKTVYENGKFTEIQF